MTADILQEFLNNVGVLSGFVCGILLVSIFAVVWGYRKDV